MPAASMCAMCRSAICWGTRDRVIPIPLLPVKRAQNVRYRTRLGIGRYLPADSRSKVRKIVGAQTSKRTGGQRRLNRRTQPPCLPHFKFESGLLALLSDFCLQFTFEVSVPVQAEISRAALTGNTEDGASRRLTKRPRRCGQLAFLGPAIDQCLKLLSA